MENTPLTTDFSNIRTESVEEFLAKNLNDNQKSIIKIISEISSEDAVAIYKTCIFCFLKNDLPARELIIAHCCRELLNVFTRRNDDFYKKNLQDSLANTHLIKELNLNRTEICELSSTVYKKIKTTDNYTKKIESNDTRKIYEFIRNNRPYISEKELNDLLNNVKPIKDLIEKFRHFNGILKKDNTGEIKEIVNFVDNLIILTYPRYSEMKIQLDNLLSLQETPNPNQIDTVIKCINKSDLNFYFFSKLKNINWFKPLFHKGLLDIPQATYDENGNLLHRPWPANEFILSVMDKEPELSYNIIKPFLDINLKTNKDVNISVVVNIVQMAILFSDEHKSKIEDIANSFYIWISSINSRIFYPIDFKIFYSFLKKLLQLDCKEFLINIFKSLLALNTYENDSANKQLINKFEDYEYEKILEMGQAIFSADIKEFIEILALTLGNVLINKENADSNLCMMRSAIEKHEQDRYNTGHIHLLIECIRDSISTSITNNPSSMTKLINILEKYQYKIFTRIILYLLKQFPADKKIIAKYLTSKENFDDYNLHHEYYMLMNQEFKNLKEKDKKIILQYIDDGPDYKHSNIDFWRFNKLYCIKDALTGKWLNKFNLLSKTYEQSSHPEFNSYLESGFVGNQSPKNDEEISKMSLNDIISFLTQWAPNNNDMFRFDSPNIAGMSDILEKDIIKNPRKYLDSFLLFKNIKEPTYIRHIFHAIIQIDNKTNDDWNNIIELAKWTLTQENPSDKNRDDFYEDKTWIPCYIQISRLFLGELAKHRKEKSVIGFSNNIYDILKDFVLRDDPYLSKENKNSDDDKYFTRAINSMHGESLSCLIEYFLYMKNLDLPIEQNKLTDIFDILIKNKKCYLESFSVIGRYLPWINLIAPMWLKNNLNIILPENDNSKDKFDAVWFTYILYVNPFKDIFNLLKPKYFYFAQNYLNNISEFRTIEKHFIKHVAIYYVYNDITLYDDIIDCILKNQSGISEFLYHIGSILEQTDTLSDKQIEKCKSIWMLTLNIIKGKGKGKEKEYENELKQFIHWYNTKALDKDWLIEQLSNIVLEKKIKLALFHIKNILLSDLETHTEKIWQIVVESSKLYLSDQKDHFFYISNLDFIKQCMNYIKNHGTAEQKKIKDELINKFMDKYGMSVFSELEPLLEHHSSKS